MSEEEKNEQHQLAGQSPPQDQKPTTIASEQLVLLPEAAPSDPTNQPPQEQEMEVHHHTHHEHGKRNWKSYFWEFLMLFLAVFCGFLAEYQLEHTIEKDREKQFIRSLVSDLSDDTASITQQINNVDNGILLFDTLSRLLESPAVARANGETIYYTARLGVRLTPWSNNNRTIDQLKNAGGFRLIRSAEASGKIMQYYSAFPELRMLEEIFEKENAAFKEAASRIMDQSIYRQQNNADGSITRITGDLPLLTYDTERLNQLGFYAIQMNGSRKGIKSGLIRLKQIAAELIVYLNKAYRLE